MPVHIVQKGDTLWKIAKQHGIGFEELKRVNAQLANPDYVVPGMEVLLPEKMKESTSLQKQQPVKEELPQWKPTPEFQYMPEGEEMMPQHWQQPMFMPMWCCMPMMPMCPPMPMEGWGQQMPMHCGCGQPMPMPMEGWGQPMPMPAEGWEQQMPMPTEGWGQQMPMPCGCGKNDQHLTQYYDQMKHMQQAPSSQQSSQQMPPWQ